MGEGMGLGLSISYGIVEDYGGQIQVKSAEGKGTTFILSFPTVA
jgi:signal transduction histidine kinase